MLAALCTRYGSTDHLHIREVPTPQPARGQVLIRILAATVNSADYRIRSLDVPRGLTTILRLVLGWSAPRQPILGTECVGVIAALGPGSSRFRVGDEVVCNRGIAMGCHAEYLVTRETSLVLRPPGLTDEEAASLAFGSSTALHFLRDLGKIQPGHHVLVIGACGTVGSAAVQLARHFGATVTTLTRSANQELAQTLGAHRTLSYETQDFTEDSARYDLIFDAVNGTTWARARRVLAPQGRLLMVAAEVPGMLRALSTSFSKQRALSSTTPDRVADLQFAADLAAEGHFRPLVDSVLPLTSIREAHQRVQSHRKRGSIVLRMSPA